MHTSLLVLFVRRAIVDFVRGLQVDRVTFCNHVNTNSATTSWYFAWRDNLEIEQISLLASRSEQQPPSAPAAVGGTTPTQPLPAQGQQQPVSGAGSGSSSPQPAPSPALSKVPETSAVSINDVSKSKSPSESQPAPASPPQSQPQPSQNANPAAALAQPSALPAEGKQTKTSKHSCAYVPSGPTQLGPDNITLVQAIQYTRRTPPFTVQSGDVLRLLKTAQTLPVAAVGYLFGAKGKQCRVGVALVDQDGRPFIRWDPAANVDVCLGVADVTAARLIDTAWKAKMKEFKASSQVPSPVIVGIIVAQETKGNGVELRPRNGLGHALTDLGGSSSSAATPTAGKSKGSGKSKGKGKETQPANQPTDEGAGPVLVRALDAAFSSLMRRMQLGWRR